MSSERVLSNARVVSAERVFVGSVLLRDGLIAAVDEGRSHLAGAEDLGGDYLLPGLVELHTDNLEKHMTPRPGVDWPSASAVLAHDAQIVAAGITTVFDALSIGDVNPKGKRMQQLPKMLEAIGEAAASGDARADHRLHLQQAGSSYQQTLDELRRELAEHYLLNSELPIQDIAQYLGFTESRSFHRSFKGWTGQTPGEYRQRRKEPAAQ